MQKLMSVSLFTLLLTPVLAAQSPPPSLMPDHHHTLPAPTILNNLNNVTLPISFTVKAGGYGGNERMGKRIYDGDAANLPALIVSRINEGNCLLANENVRIFNDTNKQMISFNCPVTDPAHNNLYWDADLGNVNGGYSPENDTLYAVDVVTNMFKEWYHIPPYRDGNGLQKPIVIRLHYHADGSYLDVDNEQLVIGDGINYSYPRTSLSTISFMIGYLFTAQYSNLDFHKQSGAIDVAFACMTAMAAEFYLTGKNAWQMGAEISKQGKALYYMDQPSKDCEGKKPGNFCSIDTLAQYHEDLAVFFGSGLFNRAFYLLATTPGWDTHKAYDIFVFANRHYWFPKIDFHAGACGVVSSAKYLGYDTMSVMNAFSGVGIDTRDCQHFTAKNIDNHMLLPL